ncbi:hypothetical protein ACWC0A_30610 [Streptomyces scopuliridis]
MTRQMAGAAPSPPGPDQRLVCGCAQPGSEPEEPPLTPEEEEEAGEGHVCETYYCPNSGEVESACHGGFDVCCSAPEEHVPASSVPPPQPARRPPYAVTYSVDGHLYEVALPGDAIVSAVDGALVIKHALGFVAGITGVYPIENKETD